MTLLAMGPVAGHAEDLLDSWIGTALERNPEAVAAQKKWLAAKQKVAQVRSLDDPIIGADIERSDTTRFDRYSNVEWMISQKVPWPGKRKARGTVAELEAEVVGFKFLETSRSVQARVKTAYWDLWLARQEVEVTEQNRLLLEQLEAAARSRYEAGQGSQADVIRAQMAIAKLGSDLVKLEKEVGVVQANLNRLLNAPLDTPRRVEQPREPETIPASLEELQLRARKYCCILISFLRAVEAREAALKVAKFEYAPDVEVRVEARSFDGQSGIQEYDTGVFLNFPWLWRGKRQASVREARLEIEAAQAEFDSEVNMTLRDIQDQYTRSEASLRQLKLYESSLLPQARQLIEATRAAYQCGKATSLELIESSRALRDAQLEAARARAQYGRDVAKLQQNVEPWGPREWATGLVSPDMK